MSEAEDSEDLIRERLAYGGDPIKIERNTFKLLESDENTSRLRAGDMNRPVCEQSHVHFRPIKIL